MKSEKLLQMLYLLLENNKMSAQELADKLEVSVRTIFRYVDSLTESGFPVYVLKGRNGGIAILPEFKVNRALVNKEEQIDILSSLQSLRTMNADDGQALEKLSAVFDQKPIPWLKIDPTAWSQNSLRQENIGLLRRAVLRKKFVEFNYINSKNEYRQRLVYPQQVIFKDKAWYLIGYSIEGQGMRIFKLTRMDQLQLAKNPPNSTGQQPWLSEQTDSQIKLNNQAVELRFDATLQYRIYEEFNHEQVTKEEDGSFLVKTKLNTDDWLIAYLLSFGSHLRILKPESLKQQVKAELQKTLANY